MLSEMSKIPALSGKSRFAEKILFIYCLLILLSSFSFAQQSTADGREEKLQHLKSRSYIKVTKVESNLLKLEYPDGKVLYKNISDYRPPVTDNLNYSPTYDSTIIDLTIIDTSLYYYKYKFWQEVRVGTDNTKPPLVADVNNNGLPEIYGQMKDYETDFSDNVIMDGKSYIFIDFLPTLVILAQVTYSSRNIRILHLQLICLLSFILFLKTTN